MKATKKVLLSSITTIALSASLIAGSTYALFTSESGTNVAVTAGKVNVVATVKDDFKLYSLDEEKGTQEYLGEGVKKFTNGGKVSYEGGVFTLDKVTPGDKVEFTIETENNSDVSIKYRTKLEDVTDYEDEEKNTSNLDEDGKEVTLMSGLVVKLGDNQLKGTSTLVASDWSGVVAAGGAIGDVTVSIELPEAAGNDYQELTCDLLLTVEAVQGNAHTVDPVDWDKVMEGLEKKADEGTWNTPSGATYGQYLDSIEIDSEEEFIAFMTADPSLYRDTTKSTHNGLVTTVKLTTDLDFSDYTWEPLNVTQLIIEGGNHKISNINMGETSAWRGGVFGHSDHVSLNNITFENVNVSGEQAGVIFGLYYGGAYGNLNNVTLAGTIVVNYKDAGANEDWWGVGVIMGVYGSTARSETFTDIKIDKDAKITINLNGATGSKCAGTTTNLIFGYYNTDVDYTPYGNINLNDVTITVIP